MDIFNLTAKITLDTSDYEKGIEKVKSGNEKVASNTEKQVGIIAANAYAQLAQIVMKAAEKIKELTLDLINYADRYSDLSAKYDISTKSLQELEYVAGQNGATLDGLLSTMTMMYNKAKEGDEVFDKLGVSVTDVNGNMKSMDVLFWETKSALDNVNNSGDKSALMLEAFGRNAMSIGEVLRKDTDELKAMANNAEELGLILDNNTIQSASDFNDMLAELKQQGMTALTSLLAGAENADEQINKFMDNIVDKIEKYLPKFIKFAIILFTKIIIAMAKAFPEMIGSLIDAIFEIDWFQVGWDVSVAVVKGLWQGLLKLGKGLLKIIGIDLDEGNETENSSGYSGAGKYTGVNDNDIVDMNNYEITERKSQTMEIKLTANGTTPIDQENIKLIANQLIPIIDKGMGEI